MTREDKNMWLSIKNEMVIRMGNKAIGMNELNKVFNYAEKIYDEHKAQLKAKDEENKELSKKCAEIAYDFENAVEEIEKLKTIIEEAIRKPMGVEPHSWSDYKILKDNA